MKEVQEQESPRVPMARGPQSGTHCPVRRWVGGTCPPQASPPLPCPSPPAPSFLSDPSSLPGMTRRGFMSLK